MLWLILAAGVAPAASVTPTYLHCEWRNASGGGQAELALDEAAQRATLTIGSGQPAAPEALFGADAIKMSDGSITWTVDRADLTLHRNYAFMPDDPGDLGTCKKVAGPAPRAF